MLNCCRPRKLESKKIGSDGSSKSTKNGGEDTITRDGNARLRDTAVVARGDGRGSYDMRQGMRDVYASVLWPSLSLVVHHDVTSGKGKVYMDVGVVAHATGSAYVEFDRTKVICAVYGPHAQTGRDMSFSEDGQLQCDFSYSPFATPGGRRETRGGKGDDEREFSTLLRQTLEASVQVHRLTKSVVDVHVMVLQADGGELAAATTCASMALADAGIELYDLVTSCSVGYSGDQMVLDPTQAEERVGAGSMAIALLPGSQHVTQWWQSGRFDGRKIAEALELCSDACGCVHKMMEARLTSSMRRNQGTEQL